MMAWVNLFYQVLEYAVRAMVAFKDSDEGREEWLDIIRAYESALQVDIDGDGTLGSVTRPAAAQPARTSAATPADDERKSIFD
jgi:hypothetical protein